MDAKMMQSIAQEIAQILSATVSQAEGYDLEADFAMPDGTRFCVRYSQHEGKFHIHGILNGLRKYMPYHAKSPDIGVSQDKSPVRIARDIQRRLLPDLISLTAQCRARQAEHETSKQKAREAAQSICDASNGVIEILECNRSGDGTSAELYANRSSGLYLNGVVYPDTANLELHHISIELAVKVAQVLREFAQ